MDQNKALDGIPLDVVDHVAVLVGEHRWLRHMGPPWRHADEAGRADLRRAAVRSIRLCAQVLGTALPCTVVSAMAQRDKVGQHRSQALAGQIRKTREAAELGVLAGRLGMLLNPPFQAAEDLVRVGERADA